MKKILIMLLLAATTATLFAKDPYESSVAEVKAFKKIDKNHAKLTINFFDIFGSDSDEEYERYIKLGYPKITKAEYVEVLDSAGGVKYILDRNQKTRKFVTDVDTTYGAHCLDSKHADKNGLVSLNLNEFSEFFDNYHEQKNRKLVYKKHGFCYSRVIDFFTVEYDGNLLKSVSFVFMQ